MFSSSKIIPFWSLNKIAGKLLLDEEVASAGAYSLRKLSSSYTGPSFIVRRSSDNATQSIGFIGEDLDTASLTGFIGSTNSGFIQTWFDQSGNGLNMTQTSTSLQPRIVNSGTPDTDGGKVCLTFNGSYWLSGGDVLDIPGNTMSGFAVSKITSNTGTIYAKAAFAAAQNRYALLRENTLMGSLITTNTSGTNFITYSGPITRKLFEQKWRSGSNQIIENGVVKNTATGIGGTFTGSTFTFIIGGYNNSIGGTPPVAGYFLTGTIQEIIIWFDGNINETTIRSNMTSYWSIT